MIYKVEVTNVIDEKRHFHIEAGSKKEAEAKASILIRIPEDIVAIVED